MHQDVIDDDSECQKTLAHRLAIRAIDGLPGILCVELKSLLADQLVLNGLYLKLLHLLHQRLVDDLVTGVPGNVTRYELAVHADGLA